VRQRRPFFRFLVEHSLSLPISAAIALVWANAFPGSYSRVASALEFPVNQIGMAFFFGLAAKEIVEATAPGGALHMWRRAALPLIAACGGMAAPALVYVVVVQAMHAADLLRGWAIPCATDIAFSYMVAKAIFRRHPALPFLLLLAVADDALGLVVLVAFYPSHELRLVAGGLLMASALLTALALRRARVRSFWPYLVISGTASWAGLFAGGLHPALALVPVVALMPHAARAPGRFAEAAPGSPDTLGQFERTWKVPVQVVLFLFGLVNAGVPLGTGGRGTWAVLLAILIGKPLGIVGAVLVAVGAGFTLPQRFGRADLLVVGCAAGIGFTVALFFATAAFPPGRLLDEAKLGAMLSLGGAALTLIAAVILKVGRFATASAPAHP
jgi:Na+:H+ antiporter, NhaA family